MEKEDRIARVLAGHDLTIIKTCDEARLLLERDSFGIVILGVHFDESHVFAARRHPGTRAIPKSADPLRPRRAGADPHLPDDEKGNARVRRIVDYLILSNDPPH